MTSHKNKTRNSFSKNKTDKIIKVKIIVIILMNKKSFWINLSFFNIYYFLIYLKDKIRWIYIWRFVKSLKFEKYLIDYSSMVKCMQIKKLKH